MSTFLLTISVALSTMMLADAMAQAAGNSAADLIRQHWESIANAIPESGKITVSLSLKLKKCAAAYKQTAKISYGSKTTLAELRKF